MFIVILGDPINGFVYVGTFTDRQGAVEYVENDHSDDTAWVVKLTVPGDAVE